MKITTLLTILTTLQMSAAVYSQNKQVSIHEKSISLLEIFNVIENQSEFRIFYKIDQIDLYKRFDLQATNIAISDILDDVLKESNASYKLMGKIIVITPVNEVQRQKVTGTVTDATTGETIAGANVTVEGTTIGVVTDANGNYSIDVPGENSVLVFSFVGYLTEKLTATGQSIINIKLSPDIKSLEEVVVVGYGVTKKSDLTGAVSSVTSKNYENQPVTNISSALQGRAAGVTISNVSGAPGGDIRIRIRGANSISGSNDPLFVVDGMQLSSFNFNDLNPADIESIEILKDASATAIYGSRGANGVVMITTKKGKSEKAKVDFTANFGVSNVAHRYNLLDPAPFARQVNLLTSGTFSEADIQKFENGFGTDWQDEIFQTGKNQDYQLSVSGSTPKTSYVISGRYLDQTGIVINSWYKKYSIHTNVETKIGNRATLGAGVFLNRNEGFNNQTVGSLRGGVEQAILWSPTTPVYLQKVNGGDSTVYVKGDQGPAGKNPVANLKTKYNKSVVNTAMLNTKFSFKIADYLTLDIIGGVDANLNEWDEQTGQYGDFSSASSVGSSRQHNTSVSLLNSNILTFHKLFGSHDLTVTAVNEQSVSQYDYSSLSGQGSAFAWDQLIGYYSVGQNPTRSLGAYFSKSQLRSYIGRANYVFKNRYLITASYRADGSSKFPNHKWGYFPSFSAGWRASEETFIKDLNIFSNLKLRGGWGITGSHGVNPFGTIPQMYAGTFSYGLDQNLPTYVVASEYADSNVKWEETAQTDLGLDMGFFNNRLNFIFDYFNKQTSDLLLRVPIPTYWGGGTIVSNVAEVENKGIEIGISGVPVDTKDFTWNSSFNFSTYKNKVLALGGGATFVNSTITNLTGTGMAQNDMLRTIVGESMGTFWGLESQGIWQENEAAEAQKYGKKPGEYKYLDLDNSYTYDDSDKKVIGHSVPKYTWSFDNTFRYKNLELNVFITAVQGNKINNFDYSLSTSITGDTKRITNADVVPWTPENKSNEWPKLGTGTGILDLNSSRFLQDGSFIRFKNISLSYRVPARIVKIPLKVSVSGQNLVTITKFKGFDPEATSGGNAEINQGVVSGAYPSPRTITFSLQLSL